MTSNELWDVYVYVFDLTNRVECCTEDDLSPRDKSGFECIDLENL